MGYYVIITHNQYMIVRASSPRDIFVDYEFIVYMPSGDIVYSLHESTRVMHSLDTTGNLPYGYEKRRW